LPPSERTAIFDVVVLRICCGRQNSLHVTVFEGNAEYVRNARFQMEGVDSEPMIKRFSKVTCSAILSLTVLLFLNNEASSETQRKSSGGAPHSYWDTYKEAKDYASGGLEVRRDYTRARDLYLQVTRGKDRGAAKWAHFQLGKLYSRPPLLDYGKAKYHFQSAIKMGELWSARYLIDIYGKEQPTAANRARMLELLTLMRKSENHKIRISARQLARQYGFAR
jgi:hypothetical protein